MAGIVPIPNTDTVAGHDTGTMEADEKKLLTCGICRQLINDPRYLPCLHTFCGKCLPTIKETTDTSSNDTDAESDTIQCPTCQQKSNVPTTGVSSLPSNLIITKLTEEKLARDKLKMKHPQIQCTNCARTLREAVARCVACDDFLCQRCLESHNSIRALKQHLVITVDEFRLGKVPQRSGLPQPDFCRIHKGEILRFYCCTCGAAMCRDCTVVEHPRPEHRYVDIEEAIRQQNGDIQMLSNQCKQVEQTIESNMLETTKVADEVKKAVDNANAALNAAVERIKLNFLQSLEENRREIEARLKNIEESREALIQQDIRQLDGVKSRMDIALNMSAQLKQIRLSVDSDAVSVYAMVASALRNVSKAKLATTDDILSSVEFIPNDQLQFEILNIGQIRDDLKDKPLDVSSESCASNSSGSNHDETPSNIPRAIQDNAFGSPGLSSTRSNAQPNPTIPIEKLPTTEGDEESLTQESTESSGDLRDQTGGKVFRIDADANAVEVTRPFLMQDDLFTDSQTNSSPRTYSSVSEESSQEEYATSYAHSSSTKSGGWRVKPAKRFGAMSGLGRGLGNLPYTEPRYGSMSNLAPQPDRSANLDHSFGRMAKFAPRYASVSNLAYQEHGSGSSSDDSFGFAPRYGSTPKLAPKFATALNQSLGKMAKLAPRYGSTSKLAPTYCSTKNLEAGYGSKLQHKYASTTNLAPRFESMTNLAHTFGSRTNLASGFESMTNLATLPAMSMDDLRVLSLRSKPSDWILERSFGHKSNGETSCTWGIVINSDNDIVVTNQKSLGMSVFGRDGRFKQSVATRSRNRDVLIIDDDYYVTSRTKFVRVYDKTGKFRRQFHAVAPATSSKLLYTVFCMALDQTRGLLVLGASYSRCSCLSIHHPNGRHVNSLKIAIEPTFIAVTSQRHFIVSSHPDKLVQIVDPSSGLAIVTISSPTDISQWCPSGVCCDGYDDIYIANKATDRSRGIYKFSTSGELLECVTSVVANPYGLALTDDDHRLVVADYQSVKVFKLKCH